MVEQNIRYSELTFTPFTHTHLQKKNLTIEGLLDGLEAGRAQAKAEFGVEMRWVFDIPRNASFPPGYAAHDGAGYDPLPAETTLAYALQGMDRGVVAFGLGGFEVGAPPEPFAPAFAEAKAAGLMSVPHAGETMGAASVRGAIKALQADRIGRIGNEVAHRPAQALRCRHRQMQRRDRLGGDLVDDDGGDAAGRTVGHHRIAREGHIGQDQLAQQR